MIRGGPNGQAQECAFDPERSRDDGWRGCRLRDVERRRRPVPRHCKIHRNKWAERFRDEGVDGLPDRSSRPLSLRSQMAPASTAAIEALRQQRYTAKQFAIEVGVSAAKFAAAGVLSLCSVVSALAGIFHPAGLDNRAPARRATPSRRLLLRLDYAGLPHQPKSPPFGRQHLGPDLVDALADCRDQAAVDCGASRSGLVQRPRRDFLLWPVRSLCRRAIRVGSRPRMGRQLHDRLLYRHPRHNF